MLWEPVEGKPELQWLWWNCKEHGMSTVRVNPALATKKRLHVLKVSKMKGGGLSSRWYPGDPQDLQMPGMELHDLVFSLPGFSPVLASFPC